ncbi:MAG: VOC family protein [Bacteroidetes bacterium]|nr:VOC family protein [Bacteroidota bacterium]
MKPVPYLNFAGNAEEALNFYKEALSGEILMITRYGDSPMVSDEDWKQKLMHSRLQFGDGNMIMISDTMKGNIVSTNGNIQLSLGLKEEEKTKTIFDKLAEGGKVTMPLAKQFWGDVFGMLQDKFGVSWMLNCEVKK